MTPDEPPRLANAPFDAADADIIFRSSDNVDFRLYSAILSISSSVFKDMLSIPQPPHSSSSEELPIVLISEISQTIEQLLLFCYPAPAPIIEKLSDVPLLLDAASKYNISCVTKSVARQLVSPHFLQENPVGVYCIAARYGWEAEARKAARCTLCVGSLLFPESGGLPELELTTAATYRSLLLYQLACGKAAEGVARGKLEWIRDLRCLVTNCNRCGVSKKVQVGFTTCNLPPWLAELLGAIGGELREKPVSATIHKSKHVEGALRKQMKCPTCSNNSSEGVVFRLMDALAGQVEKEVDKVVLEFK